MNKKLYEENFIKKSKLIHKDKNNYDYSLVEYVNYKTKVKIICPFHGIFEQKPGNHLNGKGCSKCFGGIKSNLADFKNKSCIIHKFKYDYSKFIYVNDSTKGIIICPIHGEFLQTPNNHLHYEGCFECGGKKQLTTDIFIKRSKKIQKIEYDYSKTNYINMKTKVKIICNDHGIFEQIASNHLSGQGCPKCIKLNDIKFIDRMKLIYDNYDYSLVNYTNYRSNVKIICAKHGIFEKPPHRLLQGRGCPECNYFKKTNENIVRKYLESKNIIFEKIRIKLPCIKKYYCYPDFYLPNYNLIIEYNGAQHYVSADFGHKNKKQTEIDFEKQQIRDQQLRDYCKDNKIDLLEIDGRKYQQNKLIKFLENYFGDK